jgi:hypothetical protein
MITLQDTSDTTQTDGDTIFSGDVVPHHLSAAFEFMTYLHHPTDNRIANGM